MKLAKRRVFIYSKMERKIYKIRRNLYTSEKPGSDNRHIYFDNTASK